MSGTTAGEGGRFKRKEAAPTRDWEAIEASPEFQELVKARRSFLVPATIVFLVGAIGYLLLVSFAQDFMGNEVGGIPIAFIAAADPGAADLGDHLRLHAQGGLDVRAARAEGRQGRDRRGRTMIVFAADLKVLPLAVFGIVLAITLGVTYWAAKRTSSASDFYAAGRGITGFQNGWAIAGDYMSASSFLGFAGLIFLFGVDAFVGLMAAIIAFIPVLLFLAERMRNSGKYTLADVLSFRLRERPARVVTAAGTLSVVLIYLVAQMVGAGALIQALTGVSFTPAVIGVGIFMLAYVIFGGMLATTWVQIIKATLLMAAGTVLTLFVLVQGRLQPGRAVLARRGAPPRGRRLPEARAAVRLRPRAAVVRPRVRVRHRRACRTSSCASSRCRTPRRRAARSAGPCS